MDWLKLVKLLVIVLTFIVFGAQMYRFERCGDVSCAVWAIILWIAICSN